MQKIANEINNPFLPGADTQPPELAGRGDILRKALLSLARVKNNRAARSIYKILLIKNDKSAPLNIVVKKAIDILLAHQHDFLP